MAGTSGATSDTGVNLAFSFAPTYDTATGSTTWNATGSTLCNASRGLGPGEGGCP